MGIQQVGQSSVVIPKEAIFYHGSPESNLRLILLQGIIPRTAEHCHTMVDNWLADYGYTRKTAPEWVWHSPLHRCLETTRLVYLTGNKSYAQSNSQAGNEAKQQFQLNMQGWLKGDSLTKAERYAIYRRTVERYSALFKVRIPTAWLRQLPDLEGRVPLVMTHHPEMSETEAWKWLLGEVTVNVETVPPERIVGYEVVPFLPSFWEGGR